MILSKLYANFIFILFAFLACQGDDLIDDRVPAEIRVLKDFTNIFVGQSNDIELAYLNIIGNRIDNPNFIWMSSNEEVLTVNSDGKVTAISKGDATITVSIVTLDGETIRRTFEIKVQSNVIEIPKPIITPNLKINSDIESILKGKQLEIEFNLMDSNSGEDLTPEDISWTSNDDKILTVDNNGTITGIEIGTATIVLTIIFKGESLTQEIQIDVTVMPMLSIESKDTTILSNQSLTLNSVFSGLDGQPINSVDITYTSSNSDIITVDKNGKVTAVSNGVAEITAKVTFEGMSYEDKISITVNSEPKITLTETINTITEGSSQKLKAIFFDENGDENSEVIFTWNTTNNESLTVEQDGTIRAIQAEDSVIISVSVQYKGQTYTKEFPIEIKAKPIEPVLEITQKPNILEQDAESKVEFTFTNKLDNQEIQPDSITWESDDDRVVSVDENGILSAKSEGSATITILIFYNGQTFENSFSVNVMAEGQKMPIDPELSIYSSLSTLEVDQESTVSFRFINKVNNQPLEPESFVWNSLNSSIATVDTSGNILAKSEGSTTITITVVYDGQSYSDTFSLSVTAKQVVVVQPELSVSSRINSLEETQESKVTYRFINKDTNQPIQPESTTWSSSNTTVATIDNSGNILAKSEGSTTITITVVYDGQSYSDTFSLSVTAKPVVVQPQLAVSSRINSLEETQESKATYQFINKDTRQPIQPESTTWSSSNTNVATIDNSGNILAKSEGSTTITITVVYDGQSYSDTFSLSVTAKPVVVQPQLAVSSRINSLEETQESKATYQFINKDTRQPIQPESTTWSSSNTNVATIDNSGNILAKSEGSTTITITIVYNGQSYSDTFLLSVTAKPIVVEPKLSLTSTPNSLKKGEESQLSYGFINKTDDESLTPQSVSWQSGNENVVSVNSTGLITAKNPGSTTITLTINFDGQSYTDSFSIRVWIDPLLSITSTLQRIEKDDTETLSFDYFDDQGQKQSSKSVTWESSDSGVISIDSNGTITAVKVGQATLTVKTQVGSTTYSDTITVNVFVKPEVSISNAVGGIIEGTTYDLNFEFIGEDGQSTTPDSTTWESSDTGVLTIDSDGIITTVSPGSSKITITVVYQNQSYSKSISFSIVEDPNKTQANDNESFTGSISGSYGLKGSYEVKSEGDDLLITLKDDFTINNSLPDGALYLSNSTRPNSNSLLVWRGKSHYKGPNTYTVENTKLKDYQYIVIWCVAFNVNVGNAKIFDD